MYEVFFLTCNTFWALRLFHCPPSTESPTFLFITVYRVICSRFADTVIITINFFYLLNQLTKLLPKQSSQSAHHIIAYLVTLYLSHVCISLSVIQKQNIPENNITKTQVSTKYTTKYPRQQYNLNTSSD